MPRKLQGRVEMLVINKLNVFRTAIANKKSSFPHVFSATLIGLVILIVYWQDLSILANEALQSEAAGHIILIPFFISYMIYRKKEFVKASLAFEKLKGKTKLVSFSDIVGAALCVCAFLLYWYGSFTFYALEYHLMSLPLFVLGAILILSNTKTLKTLVPPILFLLFLIPPPSTITYTTGATMANFHTQASYTLLKACGLDIQLESSYGPPTITLNAASESPISFAVDLPCSGIYSLIAFIMFATFLSYIIRGSIIKKLALFLTGFLILQVLNIVRMSSIVLIGYWMGEEIAMKIFHLLTGSILLFIGMFLLFLIAEKIWKMQIFAGPRKRSLCPKCNGSLEKNEEFCTSCGKFLKNSSTKISKRFLIKVAALLLGCYLMTLSLQVPVFALAQVPETLAIQSPSSQEMSTEIFPEISGYQLQFMYRDFRYERISHQDASLVYEYLPTNISDPTVWVDVGIASSIINLHNWEVCLVAWQVAQGRQPLTTVLNSRDIQLLENPPIIARFFTFQKQANYVQVTLYWYERAVFKAGLTFEQKYVRINLLTFASSSGDYARLEEKLLTFGKSIAAYWEPKKTASLTSLRIVFQQGLLAMAIGFAAATEAAHRIREWNKKRNNLKIFEKFAPPSIKLLFKTIENVNKETEATTEAIAHALEQTTGKCPESGELIHMLNHLQENGIVEKDMANVEGNPQLVWKP